MSEPLQLNARDLEQELSWFSRILDTRFKLYFGQESEFASVFDIEPPDLSASQSMYANIVRHYQMPFAERLMLILALAPHIRSRLLDIFFTKNATFDRKFTEFGGVREGKEGDFFPTGETLAFLLAGQELELRFRLLELFDRDHYFTTHQIFDLQPDDPRLPLMKAPLRLTEEYLSYFTTGAAHRPHFSTHFPARQIETKMEWEDLVLASQTLSMVREVEAWIQHGPTLMQDWGMAAKLRPGFRSLFYGPPGTGKTMTACLLGKATGHEVYRVDLSMVVSKYIGETEKNLARVFDKAEHKQWILFFDEADALFGKRSETKDSHDRYANQEVAYLLQRIETFDGIAILASNLKGNLDKAFSRRFESIIFFPLPSPEERLRIWQNGFSPQSELAPEVDLPAIARRFELSGGAIMNVIRYASLEALRKGTNMITLGGIQQGVRRELVKEGKVV
ncbi:MAG: ATP-binding protein [Lewinellaceae bacterium]|nr:ATP-binding protein [Phaeodactylibacter sp.]MCB9036356.1 ATP-binding protein [Lewinellaceae bacterium]